MFFAYFIIIINIILFSRSISSFGKDLVGNVNSLFLVEKEAQGKRKSLQQQRLKRWKIHSGWCITIGSLGRNSSKKCIVMVEIVLRKCIVLADIVL